MRLVLHQSLKDLRLLRPLLQVWLAVLVLRFLAPAISLDLLLSAIGGGEHVPVPAPTPSGSGLFYAHLVASLAYVSLTVVLSLQLVQADSPVRTDAFWITRPMSRRSMWASKLLTGITLFVVLPILADAAVMALNGFAGATVLRAVAEGALEQLILVIPVMALAAVTMDVAGFALSVLASLGAGLLALIAAFVTLGPAGRFTEPPVLPGIVAIIACGLVVTGAQFVARSRRAGIGLVALSVLVFALVVRFSAVQGVALVAGGPGVRRVVGGPFSAALGSRATVLGRRVSVIASECTGDACRLVIREVRPAFALGADRSVQVDYALVEPETGRPMLPARGHTTDKLPYGLTGPHVAIAWKSLEFDARAAGLDADSLPRRMLAATVFEPGEAGRVR